MKYYLPTIRSDKEGFLQLARLKNALKDSVDEELVVDFSMCSFFDANMAASLKAVLATVSAKPKNILIIKRLPPKIERILCKNHFLCEYGYSSLPDTNQTTLPYKCFNLTIAVNLISI